jgi:hypothetical protein
MDDERAIQTASTRIREHLSYANVMATLAVFIALGGGAWAIAIGRNDVGSRELAKNSVGSSELKDDKTKGQDVDESSLGEVPSAATADSADIAKTATTADSANTAETAGSAITATTAGSAVTADTATKADPPLFAHINANGTVDTARSRGIASANISHDPNSGSYCISGLAFTPKTIVGNVDSKASPGVLEASTVPANFTFCPATTQIELTTFDPEPISFKDFNGGFYIWVN